LIKCAHVNLEKKKLIDSTCEEFAEFFENIELGKEFLKKDLFEEFKKEYEEYEEMELRRFTKWLKDAAQIKGIRAIERKSGTERFIRIGENKNLDVVDATLLSSQAK